MSEQRDMSGTISRNEDKSKPDASETWPDYKGAARIEGRDYWLAGWIKTGPHGKFLSLAVTPKDATPETRAPAPAADDGDGLPF
jgi:hypothetical protein